MISVGIREFRKGLRGYFETAQKTPLCITSRGKTLAVIAGDAFFDYLVANQNILEEESQVHGTEPSPVIEGDVISDRLESEVS